MSTSGTPLKKVIAESDGSERKRILSDRQAMPVQRPAAVLPSKGKSEGAKDTQIARLKERVHKLEQQVRDLQQENELLYGKLAHQ
jgi:cell division protein FtsB